MFEFQNLLRTKPYSSIVFYETVYERVGLNLMNELHKVTLRTQQYGSGIPVDETLIIEG